MIPDAGGRHGPRVVGKVARRAAEGALNAIGNAGITAIQDLGEEVRDKVHDVTRQSIPR
jgi:hypothetical protein